MSQIFDPIESSDCQPSPPPVHEAFVDLVRRAAKMPASDLFFHSGEDDVTISVRHLGTVKRLSVISTGQGSRLVNHVKAAADMDLVSKHHPQDGRCVCEIDPGRKVDLRISTIPTLHGEDMSIRLLQRDTELLDLDCLGFDQKSLRELTGLLNKPGGLLLVTGPAGAGKTTTLYACLKYLHDGTRKINTIEDPVEYSLEGIHQSQVNPRIGLDFPELMRSLLRHTPDVIMVGEIRDPVTAETAVRAANSGRLVLATLHAPIAAGAIDSMLALGVAPHFLGTALLGILSQRLVRTLCPHCRIPMDIRRAPHVFDRVRPWLGDGQGEIIHAADGCPECRHDGYTQCTGVVEVLKATPEVRQMIFQNRPASEIQGMAVRQGMLDLRRAALLKVAQGWTGTEELVGLGSHLA